MLLRLFAFGDFLFELGGTFQQLSFDLPAASDFGIELVNFTAYGLKLNELV